MQIINFLSQVVAKNQNLLYSEPTFIPPQSHHESQTSSETDYAIQEVWEEMNKRATNLGYGLGVGLNKLAGGDYNNLENNSKKITQQIIQKTKINYINYNSSQPLSNYFDQIFPQETIRILYVELDPGVDDGVALIQLLGAQKNTLRNDQKKIEIVGLIPCVGNAVLDQTILNTFQFITLTNDSHIPVYKGAKAPLYAENNATLIEEINQGINSTHFYGHDGESDVGGWPPIQGVIQSQSGETFAADLILNTPPEKALTLVSTSSLTQLAKTFQTLEKKVADQGLPPGIYAKSITAISIMGGCLDPKVGCNAPFNIPNDQKNSEANFYFDSEAAAYVFDLCQKYHIPILLAPLDLTQEPGLLWKEEHSDILKQMDNPVSRQMAKVTRIVPYLDIPVFPASSYPMHDLHSAAALLYPQFYNVTRIAAKIGNVGEILIDNHAEDKKQNIFVLGMSSDYQAHFYETILNEYKIFKIEPANNSLSPSSVKKIIIATAGVIVLTLGVLFSIYFYKKSQKNKSQGKTTEVSPLLTHVKIIDLEHLNVNQ